MRVLHVGDDYAALRPCGLTFYSDALMRGQAAAGHDVAYVFAGRHYPLLRRPRFKRWTHGDVHMYELIGSPNHSHWELGTREPLLDLEEPVGEGAFMAALREARPDVVHIHELSRMPSSVIDHAKAAGVPVVMTLHDYQPVCASVRLLDADGARCTRLAVGEDCARNCAGAPSGREHLIEWTMYQHRRRLRSRVGFIDRLDFSAAAPLVGAVTGRLLRSTPSGGPDHERSSGADEPGQGEESGALPEEYQRRRDVNVARLSRCDRLIAPSRRVADVYGDLGADRSRIVVQRLTLPRLEGLRPGRGPELGVPVRFVTLGGCASVPKGSHEVVRAVTALEDAGRGGDYRLIVLGHIEPAVSDALSRFESVSLVGPYEPEDLDRLLDDADVGLVPSVWEEPHGFVGIEMLAKGLPVIGSDLGGIPEYVRPGETGWLNRSASGAELAELMGHAIDNRDEVEDLRRSVRSRRPQFLRPMSEHVAEVEEVYAELLSAAAGADHASMMSSPAARRAGS